MINHWYPGYNAVTVFLHLSAQFPAGNGALCGASSEVQPGGVPGCGALEPSIDMGDSHILFISPYKWYRPCTPIRKLGVY